jgi:hypothetical protein
MPLIPPRYFANNKLRRIYILQRTNWTFFDLSKLEGVTYLRDESIEDDYKMFSVEISSLNDWKNFLIKSTQSIPEHFQHSIYEALIYYAALEQDRRSFDKYSRLYLKLKHMPKNKDIYNRNEFKLDLTLRAQNNINYFNQAWDEIKDDNHGRP